MGLHKVRSAWFLSLPQVRRTLLLQPSGGLVAQAWVVSPILHGVSLRNVLAKRKEADSLKETATLRRTRHSCSGRASSERDQNQLGGRRTAKNKIVYVCLRYASCVDTKFSHLRAAVSLHGHHEVDGHVEIPAVNVADDHHALFRRGVLQHVPLVDRKNQTAMMSTSTRHAHGHRKVTC